jgi:hypothetical protein
MSRLAIKRAAYVVAAVATLVGCGGGMGGFLGLIAKFPAPLQFWAIAVVPLALAGLVFAGLIALFISLALRPRPWGKLVCVVGVPWIGFSAIFSVLSQMGTGIPYNPLLLLPGIGGATLLAVGLVLLVLDGGRLRRVPEQPLPTSQ